jgi:hypothetical protein
MEVDHGVLDIDEELALVDVGDVLSKQRREHLAVFTSLLADV